jgi:hypothetical protein
MILLSFKTVEKREIIDEYVDFCKISYLNIVNEHPVITFIF